MLRDLLCTECRLIAWLLCSLFHCFPHRLTQLLMVCLIYYGFLTVRVIMVYPEWKEMRAYSPKYSQVPILTPAPKCGVPRSAQWWQWQE